MGRSHGGPSWLLCRFERGWKADWERARCGRFVRYVDSNFPCPPILFLTFDTLLRLRRHRGERERKRDLGALVWEDEKVFQNPIVSSMNDFLTSILRQPITAFRGLLRREGFG